jgi:hypothetical protein
MKVGDWSVEGLARGLESSGAVTDAADRVGQNALEAMRKTLSGLTELVGDEVNLNPSIRPVLDLSEIQKNASQIGSLLTANPVGVGVSYNKARNLSEDYAANQRLRDAAVYPGGGDQLNFTQNNYSPKALSSAEIYRNTKNQISTAKGALKK